MTVIPTDLLPLIACPHKGNAMLGSHTVVAVVACLGYGSFHFCANLDATTTRGMVAENADNMMQR